MKQFVWIFVGIIAGYLLGGIKPRFEVEKQKEEMQELRDSFAQRKNKRQGAYIPLISDNLDLPKTKKPKKRQKKKPPSPPKDSSEAQSSSTNKTPQNTTPEQERQQKEQQEKRKQEQLEILLDTQRIRAEQSRVALIEQAGFDDEEVEAMDDIIDELNSELTLYADDMLALIELQSTEGAVDDQTALELTHKISGVLYESQKDMDALVGEGVVDDSAKRIFNHIDLDFLLEEAELENTP